MKSQLTRRSFLTGAGASALAIASVPVLGSLQRTNTAHEEFLVTSFGAKPDGKTVATESIQKAIDAAGNSEGAIVVFPSGVFLSGSLHLRSNLKIRLNSGAVLRGAPAGMNAFDPPEPNLNAQWQDFGHSHFQNALIWGESLENISITGPGTIDGGGLVRGDAKPGDGDKLLSLKECHNIILDGLTLLQGGHFILLATGCSDIQVKDLTVKTTRDGLDIVGCKRVTIRDCDIQCLRFRDGQLDGAQPVGGDDAITLKSDWSLGRKIDCEDILVERCRLATSCSGVIIGSETIGDFRRIQLRNLNIWHADKAGITIETNDGGNIDGVVVENVAMEKISRPFVLYIGDRLNRPTAAPPGRIRNITLKNISATNVHGYIRNDGWESVISGRRDHPIESVTLQDICIVCKGAGTAEDAATEPPYPKEGNPRIMGRMPAYGLFCRNVMGLTIERMALTLEAQDARPGLRIEDVTGIMLDHDLVDRKGSNTPSLVLIDTHDVTIRNCSPWPVLTRSDQLKNVF